MLIVYTGDGKGKTSAALGAVFRALGHGWRVLVLQFMKGDWPIVFGELETAKRHKKLEFLQLGTGFVRIMGDKKPFATHRDAASRALGIARRKISSRRYKLVVLDEACVALGKKGQPGLFSAAELFELLKGAPESVHLIVTGRGAPRKLVQMADLVTEMKEIKHPFRKGIPAMKGIDY